VLAGGPLRAAPATLLARSRLVDSLAGGLVLVGAVGGALLGLDARDGGAGPLPVGPLGGVMGLGAEGLLGVGDLVGVSVVFDLGGGGGGGGGGVGGGVCPPPPRPRVDSGTGPSASMT
jgi:hypothetical protein